MSKLIWQPIHLAMDERARTGDCLIWTVAPFVKVEALKRLFDSAAPAPGLKVVSRWLPSDLVSGVSDLEVFAYLKEWGCELYVIQHLEMKLYVFNSNWAVSTSANLTLHGLGYVELDKANIEVGNEVDLSPIDWMNLYRVIRGSRLMTAELYARFEEYVNANPPGPPVPEAPGLLGPAKKFTIASLPAMDSPEELAAFYFNPTSPSHTPETARRAFQDLATFGITPALPRLEFDRALGNAFRDSPFVVEFVDYLRAQRSLRFGAVNTWIHEKCEDVPLPYRWEIKTNTRALYNWLAHFFHEVTWDRPHHSQVIYWKAG